MADIGVIAVPHGRVAPVLAEHQKRGTARVYTDVSGVKAPLHREALAHGCDLSTLVGGHPVVSDGATEPREDLFEGCPWALTPSESTEMLALNHALELVALCGAASVLLDPEAHDRAVALVSHAPRLLASLAAARLLDEDESAVRLAGQDLRDVTGTAAWGPGAVGGAAHRQRRSRGGPAGRVGRPGAHPGKGVAGRRPVRGRRPAGAAA